MKDEKIKQKQEKLIEMLSSFCDDCLNDEYKGLSIKLVEKLGRKHDVPFKRGKLENWASGIIYALAQINFLFDKSFEPYLSADDICDYFQTKKSTVSSKAKNIRDMLKMEYFDSEFSTSHMQSQKPSFHMEPKTGLIMPEGFENRKLEMLMDKLSEKEDDDVYIEFIEVLMNSTLISPVITAEYVPFIADDEGGKYLALFTSEKEFRKSFTNVDSMKIPFFVYCHSAWENNGKIGLDGVMLNPENQAFFFSPEHLVKYYELFDWKN